MLEDQLMKTFYSMQQEKIMWLHYSQTKKHYDVTSRHLALAIAQLETSDVIALVF
jgi:hypothetical protein